MEDLDYDAAESTIKIHEITTDETNREILRRLKENDPDFVGMWVKDDREDNCDYCPEGAHDMGWLGYVIGKNTILRKLNLRTNIFQRFNNSAIEAFCTGVNSNRSIQIIRFSIMDLSGGEIFQSLRPFFGSNSNLAELKVQKCVFGIGCARQLSVALRGCNTSLKSITIGYNQMGDGEQSVEIIESLVGHPKLESLELFGMNICGNECRALASLLSQSFTELRELNLYLNDIDDEGVDALVGALPNSELGNLTLSENPNITARGWKSIAAMLKNPYCNLKKLHLIDNNIDDEGALVFAYAMARNSKLKVLCLSLNAITTEGYFCFSKVLCNTSSINRTFLSNHTLEHLGVGVPNKIPDDIQYLLDLNSSDYDKRQVAIKKILKHHQHFDMQPFFEWDLKVLPIAVDWFERAQSIANEHEARIGKQKLGTIYQFIRAMPEVFEPAPGVGDKRKRSVKVY